MMGLDGFTGGWVHGVETPVWNCKPRLRGLNALRVQGVGSWEHFVSLRGNG
jgi:hypothetical protein